MSSSAKRLLAIWGIVSALLTFVSLAGGGGGSAFLLGLMIFVGGYVYFIPSICAFNRSHANSTAIFALNLLLGWIVVPWVAALVWALSRDKSAELLTMQVERGGVGGAAMKDADMRDCPFCAEPIRKAAVKCKHCGSAVPAA